MNDAKPDPKLEALVHRELRSLPLHRAPASLAPRVLAALQTGAELAWWQRAWWQWPVAARVSSALAALILLALAVGGFPLMDPQVAPYQQWLGQQSTDLLGQADELRSFADTLVAPWEDWLQEYRWHVVGGVAGLYFLCLGAATALVRTLRRSPLSVHPAGPLGLLRRWHVFHFSL